MDVGLLPSALFVTVVASPGFQTWLLYSPNRQIRRSFVPALHPLSFRPQFLRYSRRKTAFISTAAGQLPLVVSHVQSSERRALRVYDITASSAEHAKYGIITWHGSNLSSTEATPSRPILFNTKLVRKLQADLNRLLIPALIAVFSFLNIFLASRCVSKLATGNVLHFSKASSALSFSSRNRAKSSFAAINPIILSNHGKASCFSDLHELSKPASTVTTNSARLATATPVARAEKREKPPVQRSLIGLACVMFTIAAALAAAETAITTLWPWKVRELAEKEGPKSPFAVLDSDLTRFLTTILVSTTSATIFSTAIVTELAGEVFGGAAVGYVTAIMTVFFLFFGEILPKALAVHAPAKVARIMVPFINTLSFIVYPVGKLLASISTFILRMLKLPFESGTSVSEEELRLIVAGAGRSGSIEKYESQIIHNVLDLEETDVKSIMCPRVDMVALSNDRTLTNLLDLEKESHYSRMPVFENTIDNIVGVALAKSLLGYLNEDPALLQRTKVSEVMDPAFFVPESTSVWIALEEMRKRRLHMAIVVDEYGGTAGLVTLEDILEEVVGEIYDEDDDYEAESQCIAKSGENAYAVDGQTSLEKVVEALNLTLAEEDLDDYGTISGFICAKMDGIPDVGEELVVSHVRFRVVEADDRRIVRLKAEVLTKAGIAQIVEEEKRVKESEAHVDDQDLARNVLDIEPVPKKQKLSSHSNENGIYEKEDMKLEGMEDPPHPTEATK